MADQKRRDTITSRLRLRDYDYSQSGTYFVTICTAHRACLFGEVRDGEVELSHAGLVIESWLLSIPAQFRGVAVDSHVVMPNHVHAVIMLGAEDDFADDGPLPSVGDIVGWFKSMSTRDYILGVSMGFWPRFSGRLWQQRFYDHIIRSDTSLDRITTYIEGNPAQWEQDENNPERSNM